MKDIAEFKATFVFIAAIGIGILIFLSRPPKPNYVRERYDAYYKSLELKGIVTDIYNDRNNRGQTTILIQQNNSLIRFSKDRDLDMNFYKDIKVGDSIYKTKDSLQVTLIRDSIAKIYQYHNYSQP